MEVAIPRTSAFQCDVACRELKCDGGRASVAGVMHYGSM